MVTYIFLRGLRGYVLVNILTLSAQKGVEIEPQDLEWWMHFPNVAIGTNRYMFGIDRTNIMCASKWVHCWLKCMIITAGCGLLVRKQQSRIQIYD